MKTQTAKYQNQADVKVKTLKMLIVNTLLLSSAFLITGCSESVSSESKNKQSSSYQEVPTYEQWQNVEIVNYLMMILQSLGNGCGYGGDIQMTDPYGWQEREGYGRYGYYEPWMR